MQEATEMDSTAQKNKRILRKDFNKGDENSVFIKDALECVQSLKVGDKCPAELIIGIIHMHIVGQGDVPHDLLRFLPAL